jgi:hypothetical protein
MPIAAPTVAQNRYNVNNPKLLLPVLSSEGAVVPGPNGVWGLSYAFQIFDQPVTIVASDFLDSTNADIVSVQTTPDGVNWQDLWVQTFPVRLLPQNSMVVITVPGTYRLARLGWGTLNPDELGTSKCSMIYGTLTHEPNVSMTPIRGGFGPAGLTGPAGVTGATGVTGSNGDTGVTGWCDGGDW